MKEKSNIVSPILYLQHHYELLKAEYEYEKEKLVCSCFNCLYTCGVYA